jgi:hypothetical protein
VKGYTGAFCAKCSKGYFRSTSDFGKSNCERCLFSGSFWFVLAVGTVLLLVTIVALYTWCKNLETEFESGTEAKSRGVALQSLWTRITTLRNLNGVPFPPIFRTATGWFTSLFAFAASIHPECTIEGFDFPQQWTAVIVGFFVLLTISYAVDRCRESKGFYLMDNLVLSFLLPQALQFSFQAVTCVEAPSGGLVLYVEPSISCPFPSRNGTPMTIQAMGGFSVLFIIIFIPLRIQFSLYQSGDSPFLLLFHIVDVLRQCMAPLSVPSPVSAVAILLLTTIVQVRLRFTYTCAEYLYY